jgi:hypothetical protein
LASANANGCGGKRVNVFASQAAKVRVNVSAQLLIDTVLGRHNIQVYNME